MLMKTCLTLFLLFIFQFGCNTKKNEAHRVHPSDKIDSKNVDRFSIETIKLDQAKHLFEIGQLKKSLNLFKDLTSSQSPYIKISSLLEISIVYTYTGQIDEAAESAQEAVSLIEEGNYGIRMEVVGQIRLARSLWFKSDFTESHKIALSLEQKIKERGEGNTLLLFEKNLLLGVTSYQIGQFSEAENYLNIAKSLKQKDVYLSQANELDLVCLDELEAKILSRKGLHSESINLMKKALKKSYEILEVDHPIIARMQGEVGNRYLKSGDFKNAIISYEKTYEIIEKFESKSVSHFITYLNMGIAYHGLERLDECKKILNKLLIEIGNKSDPLSLKLRQTAKKYLSHI